MTRTDQDRSQQAMNNLNNKVDQKRLAYENRLLRWLCVLFVVALVLTLLIYPHVLKGNSKVSDSQSLRNYSDSVGQSDYQPIAFDNNRGSAGQSWVF